MLVLELSYAINVINFAWELCRCYLLSSMILERFLSLLSPVASLPLGLSAPWRGLLCLVLGAMQCAGHNISFADLVRFLNSLPHSQLLLALEVGRLLVLRFWFFDWKAVEQVNQDRWFLVCFATQGLPNWDQFHPCVLSWELSLRSGLYVLPGRYFLGNADSMSCAWNSILWQIARILYYGTGDHCPRLEYRLQCLIIIGVFVLVSFITSKKLE